jgi:3-oxoacyl-(acyl-carrier-protein) synthase
MIVARRLLLAGIYRNVIVVGADVLSHFITSGFISFKSVSSDICCPYDAKHKGLNLGEACGSILLTTDYSKGAVVLRGGTITNDANHISGPSRTGDGLYHAIYGAMSESGLRPKDIDYINLHGTATVFNDEMEAQAIHCAKLHNKPVNSLKPYLGHTLGASGIIESILCIAQLKSGTIFGTLGYEDNGVSLALNVSSRHRYLPVKTCIKTASGFGGCNAAVALSLDADKRQKNNYLQKRVQSIKQCSIEKSCVSVNGNIVYKSDEYDFALFIRKVYKNLCENNMKFYKMDDLSKLAYIAANYLLNNEEIKPFETGIILANSASSLDTDRKHQQLIYEGGDKAASPAVFVYTLPNVLAGEICIRHKIRGENTFFIEQSYLPDKLKTYAKLAMENSGLASCICGWCDYLDNKYKAEFELIRFI